MFALTVSDRKLGSGASHVQVAEVVLGSFVSKSLMKVKASEIDTPLKKLQGLMKEFIVSGLG